MPSVASKSSTSLLGGAKESTPPAPPHVYRRTSSSDALLSRVLSAPHSPIPSLASPSVTNMSSASPVASRTLPIPPSNSINHGSRLYSSGDSSPRSSSNAHTSSRLGRGSSLRQEQRLSKSLVIGLVDLGSSPENIDRRDMASAQLHSDRSLGDSERVPSDPHLQSRSKAKEHIRHVRNKSADARFFISNIDDDDDADSTSRMSHSSRRSAAGEHPVVLVFDNKEEIPAASALFPNSNVIARPGQDNTTEFIVLPPAGTATLSDSLLRSTTSLSRPGPGYSRTSSLNDTIRPRAATNPQRTASPRSRNSSDASDIVKASPPAARNVMSQVTAARSSRSPVHYVPMAEASLINDAQVLVAPAAVLTGADDAASNADMAKKKSRKKLPLPKKALHQQDTVCLIAESRLNLIPFLMIGRFLGKRKSAVRLRPKPKQLGQTTVRTRRLQSTH